MQKRKSIDGNDDTDVTGSSQGEEELKTEEDKLKQEIEELKSIITQTNLSLSNLKYGNVKTLHKATSDITTQALNEKSIPNISTNLQNELYRYSGFYCRKFTNTEYIFNFTSNTDPNNNFAIQIFNKNNKGSLGKWVLPTCIDIDEVLSEYPIDNLKNMIPFLKKCKHLIFCYRKRQEEFDNLKKTTEKMKNFSTCSDMGYTQVNMEFFGMHNKQNEKCINIIVYLLYKTGEIRPHKIKIESINNKKVDDKTLQNLKQLFKCFKILSLEDAFEQVNNDKNDSFSWSQIDEDTPLELNFSSSSEEDLLDDIKQRHKKAMKRKKQLKELHKKWKQQSRRSSRHTLNQTDVSSDEDHPLVVKKSSKNDHSVEKKGTNHVSLSQKRLKELKNKSNITMTSTMNETKKLKQTKLKFGAKNAMESEKERAPSMSEAQSTSSGLSTHKKKITDVVTSTPLYPTKKRHLKMPDVDLEISDIVNTTKKVRESVNDTNRTQKSKKVTFETRSKLKKRNGSLEKLRRTTRSRK